MKPILQALLLADNVYDDRQAGRKVVAGIFHVLHVKKRDIAEVHRENPGQPQGPHQAIPAFIQGSPSAYISMTSVRGPTHVTLQFVNLSDNGVLFKIDCDVNCNDPTATVEVVLKLPLLVVPEPGMYAAELLCDEEPIGTYRVKAIELL